jgi:hypothetical protein
MNARDAQTSRKAPMPDGRIWPPLIGTTRASPFMAR